ncbi:ATP binding [Dispira simplex]|nr:ATP binding [Dispira simplex]
MASSPLKQYYPLHTASTPTSPCGTPRYQLTEVLRWDESQVAKWLQDNRFGKYGQRFIDNNITGDLLFELDYKLLRELNITTVGERIKLSVAIKKLLRTCLQSRDALPLDSSTTPGPSASSGSLPLSHSDRPGVPESPPVSSPRYSSSLLGQHSFSTTSLTGGSNPLITEPSGSGTGGGLPPVSPRSVPNTGDGSSSAQAPPSYHLLTGPPPSASSLHSSPRLGPHHHHVSATYDTRRSKSPVSPPIMATHGAPSVPLSSTAPLMSKRRHRPASSLATDNAVPSGKTAPPSARSEKSSESIYRLAENLQVAIMGVPDPAPSAQRASRVKQRTARGKHAPSPDNTLDNLRSQLSEFFGTSSDADGSTLAGPVGNNKGSGPPIIRRHVRVLGSANETRMVDITDGTDGRAILDIILNSFQIFTDTDRYSLFSVSGVEGSAKSLSHEELFALCTNTQRLEREKLILRKKHLPFNNTEMRRQRDLNETIRILEQSQPDRGPATSGGGVDSATGSFASPPAVSTTTTASSAVLGHPERPLKLSNHSQKKVANFFGERPPSELISSNLAQYFPGNEEKARYSMFRATIIHDKTKSRAFANLISKANPSEVLPPSFRRSKNGSILSPNPGANLDTSSLGHRARFSTSKRHSRIVSPPQAEIQTSTGIPRTAEPVDRVSYITSNPDSPPPPTSPLPPIPVSPDSNSLPDTVEEDGEGEAGSELGPLTDESATSPLIAGDDTTPDGIEAPFQWIQGALIGMGSFGNVYLGLNSLSGALMAIKQVEIPHENSASEARKKMMLDALQFEIKILQELRHENIVQYLGSASDGKHLNIFLEYVPGGSVVAMLDNYGPLQETLVRSFVRQILKGLQYLHACEIIHRDIKGGNILVDNQGRIKISDFGISKKIENEDRASIMSNRSSLKGSVFWMAPEVVKKTHYTRKADIWSLGCLVIEMLTGKHPFPNFTEMQAMFKIGSNTVPAVPSDISPEAKDFLTKTLALDFQERPSADELLKHPFVIESK